MATPRNSPANRRSWPRTAEISAQLAAQDKSYAQGPLVGTPEQIIERLTELSALGLGYAITYFRDAAYDRSSIELFAREVIPALA
jgi:alkanesulfonate monooxygenase SsuD/methylene tetrahydromethanopterin reductase-like flavin-dependent oxidoreductase (luciferase family)